MRAIVLYPFRFRGLVIRRWRRARHKMQMPELQRTYSGWEITCTPEIRHVTTETPPPYSPVRRTPPTRARVQ
jgi:hypothetical protein